MPITSPHLSRLSIAPRHRTLPGPRALVGGLLIAVAVVGTYAAATGVIGDDSRLVVVAARDLPPGTRLSLPDLRVIKATLPPDAVRNVATSPSQVNGTTLLGPMNAGELVQSGNVLATGGGQGEPEISFAIPSSRAVGADLRSGETVDVIATGEGANAGDAARTAVSGATVVKVDTGNGKGIGGNGDVIVTLAVADRSQAAAIAAAVDQGQVTLVRTTGIDAGPVGP